MSFGNASNGWQSGVILDDYNWSLLMPLLPCFFSSPFYNTATVTSSYEEVLEFLKSEVSSVFNATNSDNPESKGEGDVICDMGWVAG